MKKYIDLIVKWIKIVDAFILDMLYPEFDDDIHDNDISKFI